MRDKGASLLIEFSKNDISKKEPLFMPHFILGFIANEIEAQCKKHNLSVYIEINGIEVRI